jgi:hypothetical protein
LKGGKGGKGSKGGVGWKSVALGWSSRRPLAKASGRIPLRSKTGAPESPAFENVGVFE